MEISKRNEEYIEQNNKLHKELDDLNAKYKKARQTSNFWFLLPIAGWSYMLIQKNKKNNLASE